MFNGDNRLEFLGCFPDVAAHFGFTHHLYGDPVMHRPDDAGEEQEEWDRLNALAFAKLKYYVSPGVHAVVWKGQRLTAFQYFERLQTLFLNGDMHSRTTLEAVSYTHLTLPTIYSV